VWRCFWTLWHGSGYASIAFVEAQCEKGLDATLLISVGPHSAQHNYFNVVALHLQETFSATIAACVCIVCCLLLLAGCLKCVYQDLPCEQDTVEVRPAAVLPGDRRNGAGGGAGADPGRAGLRQGAHRRGGVHCRPPVVRSGMGGCHRQTPTAVSWWAGCRRLRMRFSTLFAPTPSASCATGIAAA